MHTFARPLVLPYPVAALVLGALLEAPALLWGWTLCLRGPHVPNGDVHTTYRLLNGTAARVRTALAADAAAAATSICLCFTTCILLPSNGTADARTALAAAAAPNICLWSTFVVQVDVRQSSNGLQGSYCG